MEFEISLKDVVFYAYHGLLEEERRNGNKFKVNLTVTLPHNIDLKEDKIEGTVSYVSLYELIDREMKKPVNLLETLVFRIVEKIRLNFPKIKNGRIEIEKLHPPIPGMIGSASVALKF